MKKYVLDSNALLCFLQKEKSWPVVAEILKEYVSGKVDLIMSVINYGEFLYVVKTRSTLATYQQISTQFEMLGIEFIDVDLTQAQQAADYKSQGGIAYPDCFVLTLAKMYQATILTGDKEFAKFEKDFKIQWV